MDDGFGRFGDNLWDVTVWSGGSNSLRRGRPDRIGGLWRPGYGGLEEPRELDQCSLDLDLQ